MPIRTAIRSTGLAMRDFAAEAGLDRRTIHNLVNGYDCAPTARTRYKVISTLRRLGWDGRDQEIFP